MTDEIDYLIIGGGVAGGHAVYEIRKHDAKGKILVVSKENHFPYDRPPLSKEYLAGKEKKSDVFFRADSYYKRNKVEFYKEREVQRIDTSAQNVTLEDGGKLSYKTLLIATGGRPRKLNVPGGDLDGIYYLRTIEDCDAIKEVAKTKSAQVAIVGGGFIGCEVAATLRSRGLNVTLMDNKPHLLSVAFDEEAGNWIREYQSQKGVHVMNNVTVTQFVSDNTGKKVNGVQLKDGEIIPADYVIVGIGIELNTEIAKEAGLAVDNGIVVDQFMKTSANRVFAAGDIARFYSPLFDQNLRVEHVDVAQRQGAVAGANMVGVVRKKKKKRSFDEPPYFFSYQFDLEINAYGNLSKPSRVVRKGELDAKTGFIQYYVKDSVVNGILSVNADWKDIEKAKSLIRKKDIRDPTILGE